LNNCYFKSKSPQTGGQTVVHFACTDTLQLKKKHPCGNDLFEVVRTGSDVRIRCKNCGRDLTISREKLESGIKKVIPKGEHT
jgi:hypothetical protein